MTLTRLLSPLTSLVIFILGHGMFNTLQYMMGPSLPTRTRITSPCRARPFFRNPSASHEPSVGE